MKRIIPILFILLLLLSLFSCHKKESDCYECTTTFIIKASSSEESGVTTVSDTRTICDKTEDQIRKYEKDNTDTLIYINGEVRVDTIIITLCTR